MAQAALCSITYENTLVSHPCIGVFVSPNLPIFVLFYLRLRFLEAGALSTVHVLIDGSPRASRIGRAGPRRAPKCAPHLDPLERVFYTIFMDHKLSDRGFLLYPAAQL